MGAPQGGAAKPWRLFLCRLHVWHRWRTYQADDGSGNYQTCLDCGKYRDTPMPGSVAGM
jgi:hypothetical protein